MSNNMMLGRLPVLNRGANPVFRNPIARAAQNVGGGVPLAEAFDTAAEREQAKLIAGIISLLGRRGKTPLLSYEPEDLDMRSAPCDRFADADVIALLGSFGRSAIDGLAASPSGSVTGPGVITLSYPAGTPQFPIAISALLIELSVIENTGAMGSVTFDVSGWYNRQLAIAASPDAAFFQSGAITVAPRRKDKKVQLLMLPWQVLQGKTYIKQLCMAPAGVIDPAAVPITMNVTTCPPGVLVEVQALTPVHEYYEAVIAHLTANVLATAL